MFHIDGTVKELGRLVPPLPVEHCANVDCVYTTREQLEEAGAYLYRDLETGKLGVFCGDCARYSELSCRERFLPVAL